MAIVCTTDVQQRVQKALAASLIYALRELRVEHDGKRLRLSGHVSSFYHLQLAQELVRNAAEGIEMINAVEVRESAHADG